MEYPKESTMQLKYPAYLIILLAFLFIGGCSLFENNEVPSIFDCTEKNLSLSSLIITVQNNNEYYIESLNAESLKSNYRIPVERNAPFFIHFKNDFYYYSYSITDTASAFVKRDVATGSLIDSVLIPKGGQTFQIDEEKDLYVSYGASIPSYIIDNGNVKIKDFRGLIQPIQKTKEGYFSLYTLSDNIFFGEVDTSGTRLVKNLTDIIKNAVPNPGFIYDMFYTPETNRLLFTIEDFSNAPATYLFDLDLTSNTSTQVRVGDHANIFPAQNGSAYFLSHQLTLRPNSRPTLFLEAYSIEDNKIYEVLDFDNLFGAQGYVTDLVMDGCILFASLNLFENNTNNLKTLLIRYDLKNALLLDTMEILSDENFYTNIVSISINTNPKFNGGLK